MLKIAVIADNGLVQRFALDALNTIEGTDRIVVFSCTNTSIRKRWVRHGAYYALNLLTVRNRLTRYVPVSAGRKIVENETRFASEYDGAWQVLPAEIVRELDEGGFDVVLKFGMGLLRVPPPDRLTVPILSYHHGDPDLYRGRPAGFWEMAENRSVMGQVVQVIGNRLDAGKVVASAETKVVPWSYRATLIEAYRRSPPIINRAISNAISETYLEKLNNGRNYRLPSNADVAGLVARTTSQSVKRMLYGAFKEKAWRVSTASFQGAPTQILTGANFPKVTDWQTLSAGKDYSFYADPFFEGNSAILVEALRSQSGVGEIVRIEGDEHRTVLTADGHISYPSTSLVDGREIIIPETASWSVPTAYVADASGVILNTVLKMPGDVRVNDPTLFEQNNRLYLFGNDRTAGSNLLQLWTAPSLDTEFALHPASPIRISPKGSRMGGAIIRQEGRLFRIGQDLSRGYGDGLVVFEITTLSPDDYAEQIVGLIRFADRHGPHTLNFRDNEVVFDWYHDRGSPLAGFRRLAALFRRQIRRPTATQ